MFTAIIKSLNQIVSTYILAPSSTSHKTTHVELQALVQTPQYDANQLDRFFINSCPTSVHILVHPTRPHTWNYMHISSDPMTCVNFGVIHCRAKVTKCQGVGNYLGDRNIQLQSRILCCRFNQIAVKDPATLR